MKALEYLFIFICCDFLLVACFIKQETPVDGDLINYLNYLNKFNNHDYLTINHDVQTRPKNYIARKKKHSLLFRK